jgi:hypothetical protein
MDKKEKPNVVVSLIDFCNKFKNDIRKTNVKNRIENLMFETELKQNEIENFNLKIEHDKVESKLNYLESIANTKFMTVLLFLLMLSSIILTPMGYGLFYVSFLSITLIVILTIIQILTFYVAAIKTQVYLYFNKSYGVINMITMILVPISIIGNYNTLIKVIRLDTPLIGKIVTILICIMLDISIITINTLKHDKKHKNFTTPIENEMQDKISILHMLKTIFFDWLRIKLMKPYFEIRKNFKDNLKFFKDNPENFKDNLKIFKDNSENFKDNLKFFKDNPENFKDNLKPSEYSLEILNDFKDNPKNFKDNNISSLSKPENFKDKKQLETSDTKGILGISSQDKDKPKNFKDNPENFKDNLKHSINFKDKSKTFKDDPKNFKDSLKNSKDNPENFKDSLKNSKDNPKNFKDSLKFFKDNLEPEELTFWDKYAIIKNQVKALKENEVISKKTFKHLITKDNDWKKVRKNLVNDGLAFTENTTTRRTRINNKTNEKVAK